MCGVTVCVIILSVSLTVCFYRKRQVNTTNDQESVPDPGLFISKNNLDHPNSLDNPKSEPVTEIDLDNFNIDNFDDLPTWERDAHIWINQQILCIKNENYEQ